MESGSPELMQKIEDELEDLNRAAEEVNKFEVLLEEVKENYQRALQSAIYTKNSIKKRLGSCVEKARPYYEAKKEEQNILDDKEESARLLVRAKSLLDKVRKEVDQIEGEVLVDSRGFSPERLVRLNEATIKLDESTEEMIKCEEKVRSLEKKHHEIKQNLSRLHHHQKNNIKRATEYFECCAELDCTLQCWKTKTEVVQINICEAKEKYKTAMKNLEEISNSVHQTRGSQSKEHGTDESNNNLGYEEIDAKLHPTSIQLLNIPPVDSVKDRYPSLRRESRGQSLILYPDYNPPDKTSVCLDEEGYSHLSRDLQAILDRFLTPGELEGLEGGLDLESNDGLQVPEQDGEKKEIQ